MGVSINNVIKFIVSCFSALILLRVFYPFYSIISSLQMHFLFGVVFKLAFFITVFGIGFFIPFRILTKVEEESNG